MKILNLRYKFSIKMDLETFLLTLYVYVDDWYKSNIQEHIVKYAGAEAQLSDSEVLTMALAGQWRVGVPWTSERGVVRWMQVHGRGLFPKMIGRSAFNERVRWLWGAFIYLQQALARVMASADDLYECVDCIGLPAHSLAQHVREKGHWLWESTMAKAGTNGGFYMGHTLLVSVLPHGAITGWLLGSANVDDRWLLEALLSARAGHPVWSGQLPQRTPPNMTGSNRLLPMLAHFKPLGSRLAPPI